MAFPLIAREYSGVDEAGTDVAADAKVDVDEVMHLLQVDSTRLQLFVKDCLSHRQVGVRVTRVREKSAIALRLRVQDQPILFFLPFFLFVPSG